MTKGEKITGKDAARVERERRLAEALRANLKRRKSAARAEPSGKKVEKAADSNGKNG